MQPEHRAEATLKPQDKARSIASNTSILMFAQIGGTAINFLLTPFVLRYVGVHTYGIWAFVGAIAAFASLLNLSLGRSSVRYMAVFAERSDLRTVRRIVSYSVLSHFLLGVALLTVVWALSQWLIPHIGVGREDQVLAERLLVITFATVVVAATVRPIGSVLVALERIWMTSIITLISQALYAAAVVGLLVTGAGIYGVAIAGIIQCAFQGACYYGASARLIGKVFGNPLRLSRSVLREMLAFSGWSQAVSLSSVVNRQTDALIIGAWVNVSSVALYDVGNRIAQQTRSLPLTMLTPLLPASAGVYAQGDRATLSRIVLQASRAVGFLTFVFAGLIIGTAPVIMEVWLGRWYPHVVTICVLLVVVYAVNNLTGVGTTIVAAIGKPRYEAEYAIAGMILNLAATLALAPRFGLYGILAGTLIGVVAVSLWFLWRFYRVMRLPIWEYFGTWFWRLCLGVAVAAGISRLLLAAVPAWYAEGRLIAAVTLVVLGLIYLGMLLVVLALVRFMDRRDLELIRRVLPRALQPLARGRLVELLFAGRLSGPVVSR